MALSDSEVQKQIKHMMAFIDQEAKEKVDEINAKAEEEFNIEKGRLVQQQKVKIMEYYERKKKQVELQKKIQHSNLMNQSRLKTLKAREDHVKSMLDKVRDQMSNVRNDKVRYSALLEGLICQGLLQLLESNVVIRCKQDDVSHVQAVIPKAQKVYKEMTGQVVQLTIDQQEFLSNDMSGGVELTSRKTRFKVVNTLESRLEMLSTQMMPEIRSMMFGVNTNRRFLN